MVKVHLHHMDLTNRLTARDLMVKHILHMDKVTHHMVKALLTLKVTHPTVKVLLLMVKVLLHMVKVLHLMDKVTHRMVKVLHRMLKVHHHTVKALHHMVMVHRRMVKDLHHTVRALLLMVRVLLLMVRVLHRMVKVLLLMVKVLLLMVRVPMARVPRHTARVLHMAMAILDLDSLPHMKVLTCRKDHLECIIKDHPTILEVKAHPVMVTVDPVDQHILCHLTTTIQTRKEDHPCLSHHLKALMHLRHQIKVRNKVDHHHRHQATRQVVNHIPTDRQTNILEDPRLIKAHMGPTLVLLVDQALDQAPQPLAHHQDLHHQAAPLLPDPPKTESSSTKINWIS